MLSSLPLVLLLLLVSFSLPGFLSAQKVVAAAAAVPPRDLWCVAKNNAPDQALQQAIDWACGAGGADCGPIQQNGPCYDSSDIQRTASWAFNDYYLKNGLTDDACYFSNTAALTSLNPMQISFQLNGEQWQLLGFNNGRKHRRPFSRFCRFEQLQQDSQHMKVFEN
ncbi:Plasmodesmata callose-binding protein 5 [Turnera subulata]|uniref:Plasmodesmata callose-binding protein 5 n=1 Tax=Turnera subulata TaxID=218843 RepID=A0A9Q0JCW5_9ROSI|nr:Plasmodesmata callose-binding protein 5 [Turnera subulata]